MNILIVEPDPNFGRILSSVLGNEGHAVVLLTDPRKGMAAITANAPDLVLANLDPRVPEGPAFLHALRSEARSAQVPVFVIASEVDERLRRVAESIGALEVMVRPFSILDLSGRIRAQQRSPAPEEPVGPTALPWVQANAVRLVGVWARRATGIVQVESGGGARRVKLAEGGPADLADLGALAESLHGGSIEFDACAVPGVGQHAALGRVLWLAALASQRSHPRRTTRGTLISRLPLTDAMGALPISAGVARMLRPLGSAASLGALCDAAAVDFNSVLDEVAALGALGLLSLEEPRLMPTGALPAADTAHFTTVGRRDGALRSNGGPAPDAAADRPDSIYEVRRPPSVDRHRHSGESGHPPGMRAPISIAPRTVPAPVPAFSRAPSVVPARRLSTIEEAALVKHLRRDLDVLRTADPWVVLSVSRDAESKLVETAAERLRTRFLSLRLSQLAELRELANLMLARVEDALRAMATPAVQAVESTSPGDASFQAGLRAMMEGDWSTADRRFISARDHQLDSVRNIAYAGWARVHNADHDVAERSAEGLDLLSLAEQLDPHHPDGQYFLAMVLHRRGDDEGAGRRLGRALRAEPGHVGATALARVLRRTPSG